MRKSRNNLNYNGRLVWSIVFCLVLLSSRLIYAQDISVQAEVNKLGLALGVGRDEIRTRDADLSAMS